MSPKKQRLISMLQILGKNNELFTDLLSLVELDTTSDVVVSHILDVIENNIDKIKFDKVDGIKNQIQEIRNMEAKDKEDTESILSKI